MGAELDALRASLRDELSTGKPVVCPCCERSARRYRRSIHSTMAKFLCDLVRTTFETEREWISVGTLKPENGNYSMLQLWNLARPHDKRTEFRNAKGMWRATPEGIAFAKGAAVVPKYAYLYLGKPLGFSPEMVDIRTALTTRFNYAELMGKWA